MTLILQRRVDALETATAGLDADELAVLNGVVAGTQAAGKAVIADSNVNIGITKVTNLHIGTSGSETKVDSTAAELNILDGATYTVEESNRALDLTGRVVALTSTAAITITLHEGRELYVTGTSLATYTLPEATGSGARYKFTIGEVNTSNTVIVVADTTNTNFIGSVNNLDLDAAAQGAFGSPANSDTITLNGTTTGGALGDTIELVDMATDVWKVSGQLQTPTGSNPATPFSAAV